MAASEDARARFGQWANFCSDSPPSLFDGELPSFHNFVEEASSPPPLPPRRWAPGTGNKKAFPPDVSVLSLVPPPPRPHVTPQQVQAKCQEAEDLMSFSSISSTDLASGDLNSLAGILFDSRTRAPDTTTTTQWSVTQSSFKVSSAPSGQPSFPNSFSCQSTTIPSGQLPSNYFGVAPSLHYSSSTGNLEGYFAQGSDNKVQYCIVNGVNGSLTRTPFPSSYEKLSKGPNCVETGNIQNLLSFMKKKRDNNLIDLYCSDNPSLESIAGTTSSSQTLDEVLRLFDPLIETPKKTDVKSEENREPSEDVRDSVSTSAPPVSGSQEGLKAVDTSIRPSEETGESPSTPFVPRPQIVEVTERKVTCSDELKAFCKQVVALRSQFLHDDYHTNVGLVVSPTLESQQEGHLSVKLVINSCYSSNPVTFTCDVSTSIEHIISHVVCTVFEDIRNVTMDNYVLKVRGLAEYFTSDSSLADYEYVHHCHKFDKDVSLTLISVKDLKRPLARTGKDDSEDVDINPDNLIPISDAPTISYKQISILLETLQNEIEKLRAQLESLDFSSFHAQGIVQTVKAVCSLLSSVETIEVTENVENVIQICILIGRPENEILGSRAQKVAELLDHALTRLWEALRQLMDMYSKAFRVDFALPAASQPAVPAKEVTSFLDTLLIYVGQIHQLQPEWHQNFDYFVVSCELWHGDRELAVITSGPAKIGKSFFYRIDFGEWIQFETIPMCTLPRESRLYLTLHGVRMIPADNKQSESTQEVRTALGWSAINLFNFKYELLQGPYLLGLWQEKVSRQSGPAVPNSDPGCPLLHLGLPDFGCAVIFPPVIEGRYASVHRRKFEDLSSHTQSELMELIERDPVQPLNTEEKELLWKHNHYLYEIPNALPKVLTAAHTWDWACLSDIYSMVQEWTPMAPVDALQLLLPSFPDVEVRNMAVKWIRNIGSDELCDYLPQLVQAIRFEEWDDSRTVWFLLERSLTSVRVAHHFYWLLKQDISDPLSGKRMLLLLNTLLKIAGSAFRKMIENQEALLSNLCDVANKIKNTKESLRLTTLTRELEMLHHSLQEKPTFLPLTPSLETCGIDVKYCSYFTSNTLPLKIAFKSPEEGANPIDAIYKVGDDLRQDMLTLQMIRIMDKLWLKEGLDLKIVTFTCVATDDRKGMVEMVKDADTLRKIQTEFGLTGSFKDRPIAEWLQKHTTSELEYHQAVENFTYSCAGYSVATYVLGICDRHNDNIMLTTSGHIFHIDFGKFLGDAQMFGSIKRDRAPFVLTSDMVYVINGGDKPSKAFQNFVELCCQAFNIIRRHSSLFLNLFALMVSSGIPGVTKNAVAYVHKALLPGLSECEATAHFTRMIEESLKSKFTQLNFFIHNLAQRRFTGDHNDELLLSFVPKTYTKQTDGKIKSFEVIACKKRYDPEKSYVYTIKVEREDMPDPTFVFRSYREFSEFHQKLCSLFPLAKFLPLSRNSLVGRSNTREVAEKRRIEISNFLHSLMQMAEEIAHCSLVYTFFHPLLRDQEGSSMRIISRGEIMRRGRRDSMGCVKGEVKLSIVYKNNSLIIMVMHAKNLSSPRGTAPDPYVKTYLLPDPNKLTKRKTKIMWKNCHPTFMEMLVYKMELERVRLRTLRVSVWDYDRVQENEYLGGVLIPLHTLDLEQETVRWYRLNSI